MMDMGNGAPGASSGRRPSRSTPICVSHLHADHCVDLGAYWVARQYTEDGPKPPIPVYGPRGTAERVAGLGGDGRARRAGAIHLP